MTDLNGKPPVSEIDPGRFTGKTFTRRKCFPDSKDDYSIVIDGLRAGKPTYRGHAKTVENDPKEACLHLIYRAKAARGRKIRQSV